MTFWLYSQTIKWTKTKPANKSIMKIIAHLQYIHNRQVFIISPSSIIYDKGYTEKLWQYYLTKNCLISDVLFLCLFGYMLDNSTCNLLADTKPYFIIAMQKTIAPSKPLPTKVILKFKLFEFRHSPVWPLVQVECPCLTVSWRRRLCFEVVTFVRMHRIPLGSLPIKKKKQHGCKKEQAENLWTTFVNNYLQ